MLSTFRSVDMEIVVPRLKSSLQQLYGRHHKLVDCDEI